MSEGKTATQDCDRIESMWFTLFLCIQCAGNSQVFCEDFPEGKFSFPVIHAIKQNNVDGQKVQGDYDNIQFQLRISHFSHFFSDIVNTRTTDNDLKKDCLNTMIKLGSLTYTRNTIITLSKDIRDMVRFCYDLFEHKYTNTRSFAGIKTGSKR